MRDPKDKNVKKERKEKEEDFSLLEFRRKSDKKKRQLKSAALLLFNVIVILIIIIVEFTSNRKRVDIGTVLATWGENWRYLIGLFLAVLIYYVTLGLRMAVLIFAMTGRRRLKLSFSTAILGKYYDNITPFGTGGQPFQMFNLGRKLDVGLATSLPIADYLINSLVFALMAVAVFIFNSSVMAGNDFLRIAAYIGIVVFSAVPISVIMFSIFPGGIARVAKFFCKIGHKIRLIKDLDKAENKVTSGVQKYSDSLRLVAKKWWALILVILLSVATYLSFNAIPYFVLRACGKEVMFYDTLCMSFFVYSAINIVPTPGGAGAAEGAFYAIFQSLSGEFLFWGTLLWRFCVYYSSLISGFAVTVYQYIHASRKEKRNSAKANLQTETAECVNQNCNISDIGSEKTDYDNNTDITNGEENHDSGDEKDDDFDSAEGHDLNDSNQ